MVFRHVQMVGDLRVRPEHNRGIMHPIRSENISDLPRGDGAQCHCCQINVFRWHIKLISFCLSVSDLCLSRSLTSVSLDVANSGSVSGIQAVAVETCECPWGYSGTSCEVSTSFIMLRKYFQILRVTTCVKLFVLWSVCTLCVYFCLYVVCLCVF